ncbi:hypothetical protein GCM10020000_75400 [Streptomyces olivoverticillatus]
MARVTTQEVTVGGVTIPANRMVTPSLLSANHDERVFAEPGRFDLRRGNNQQVAFGHGIHYCLGGPLARLEGKIALEALLRRFSDIRITPGAELKFHRDGLFGARSLPVTVTRA